MAITEPVTIPTTPGFTTFSLVARPIVAVSQSSFTYSQQAQKHQGQRWEFEAQLPPMERAAAEEWVAFFLRLNGMQRRFLLGDPAGTTARGIATGTPLIDGAGQTGGTLNIKGLTTSQTGIVLAGDYFQIDTGTSSRLHKIINDANSDGTGDSSFDIWPDLRESPADGAAITFSSAKGVFRLATNEIRIEINTVKHYGIAFAGFEVL